MDFWDIALPWIKTGLTVWSELRLTWIVDRSVSMRCDDENLLPNHFFERWIINCRKGDLEIKDIDSERFVKNMCSERCDTCLKST